jgi:uncharacterized damage-inducible protein DinB
MTYYGPQQLADAFRTVRKNTIQVAEEIPEEHYGFRATPETRTVAETLVHVAATTRFPEQVHIIERRSTMEGFDFMSLMGKLIAEEKAPRSKAEILELLRGEGEHFAAALAALPEEALRETVSFPAMMNQPPKSRFEMLLGPKEHEMHHRAQLMVIERMLGITPHLTRQMQERMQRLTARAAGD